MNKKIISAITIVIVSLSFLTLAQAALNLESSTNAIPVNKIFLKLEGDTQGEINGGSTDAGHEGDIFVIGYSHTIISPRDAASGLPTGKRQHKPLTITKEVDKSTPLLMNVLAQNENLGKFELRFFANVDSVETNFFTIELDNAQIASIHTELRLGINVEVVSFVYTSITWTWEDGGITATDDWEDPVV